MTEIVFNRREAVGAVVPHKNSMLLLDRIAAYDVQKRFLVSEYDITSNCIFFDPELNGVPSWVGFEFMAQSISALSGICGKYDGAPIRPGLILSVSNLRIDMPLFKSGTTVVINVFEECRVDTIFTFSCTLSQNGKQAVSAKLMVMETDDLSQLRSQHDAN